MTARLMAVGGALAVTAVISDVSAQQRRRDPLAELLTHVRRFTGPQSVGCGVHLLTRVNSEWVPAPEAALKRSLACGVDAAKKRTAFWTLRQRSGIDSWVAEGLLGTREGVVHRFFYDSAPCGNPQCEGRFEILTCDSPTVTPDASREFGFGCTP